MDVKQITVLLIVIFTRCRLNGRWEKNERIQTKFRIRANEENWAQTMSTTTYPHIEINSDGVAIISGTTTKVIEIVQDHLAHHWHAEDICQQYPYLNPAQVHAALTYFYDHQQEMEQDIDCRHRRVAGIKASRADGALQNKLRQLGHLT
jgi:uncharacterized protein (DUF433 family)